VTYTNGKVVRHFYDVAGRLSKVDAYTQNGLYRLSIATVLVGPWPT
jgi:hypothetical protein